MAEWQDDYCGGQWQYYGGEGGGVGGRTPNLPPPPLPSPNQPGSGTVRPCAMRLARYHT